MPLVTGNGTAQSTINTGKRTQNDDDCDIYNSHMAKQHNTSFGSNPFDTENICLNSPPSWVRPRQNTRQDTVSLQEISIQKRHLLHFHEGMIYRQPTHPLHFSYCHKTTYTPVKCSSMKIFQDEMKKKKKNNRRLETKKEARPKSQNIGHHASYTKWIINHPSTPAHPRCSTTPAHNFSHLCLQPKKS